MTKLELGRLSAVPVSAVWTHEALDFTPWLASVENITLLADALELDLEVEATEQFVGSFKADVLCRNLSDRSRVLIENQLGPSDHSHLGQLLTYAGGLQPTTIVWIATSFRDEHRAAIDWLNEHTEDGVDFLQWKSDCGELAVPALLPSSMSFADQTTGPRL